MPKPRNAKLESATARRKLGVRKKPYWTPISPGIHLGYRRNAGSGTWSVRVADGGAEWIKRIAVTDDLEPASPPARRLELLASGRRGAGACPAAARRGHRRKPPAYS